MQWVLCCPCCRAGFPFIFYIFHFSFYISNFKFYNDDSSSSVVQWVLWGVLPSRFSIYVTAEAAPAEAAWAAVAAHAQPSPARLAPRCLERILHFAVFVPAIFCLFSARFFHRSFLWIFFVISQTCWSSCEALSWTGPMLSGWIPAAAAAAAA